MGFVGLKSGEVAAPPVDGLVPVDMMIDVPNDDQSSVSMLPYVDVTPRVDLHEVGRSTFLLLTTQHKQHLLR